MATSSPSVAGLDVGGRNMNFLIALLGTFQGAFGKFTLHEMPSLAERNAMLSRSKIRLGLASRARSQCCGLGYLYFRAVLSTPITSDSFLGLFAAASELAQNPSDPFFSRMATSTFTRSSASLLDENLDDVMTLIVEELHKLVFAVTETRL